MDGVSPFFWRWPGQLRNWARDGLPCFVSGALPAYKVPQPREKNPTVREAVHRKLKKFLARDYLAKGKVVSLVSCFTVPKGEDDVRVVFDGTKLGLNRALWSPTFCLPTIDSLTPMLEPGTWQADIDVSEMFYNFMLDPKIRPFCGMDVQPYFADAKVSRISWVQWSRCVMGLKPSPYGCGRMQAFAEEIIRGDHTNPTNPFNFDWVSLNLPGDPTYDPRLPLLSKRVSSTGRITGDLGTYVDDLRPVGSTAQHCWLVGHWISAVLCYLGIQDALRKRTAPSLCAGAWAGTLVHADKEEVAVSVTQEKWDRARTYLYQMQEQLKQDNWFDFKTLEKQRGFLVYLTRTYPALVPFLKGIHLTVDSWRGNRDSDGWRLSGELAAHVGISEPLPYDGHPEKVQGVPRLSSDLTSLLALFQALRPPRRILRSSRVLTVFYGCGDASGAGFGSTFTAPGGGHRNYFWRLG